MTQGDIFDLADSLYCNKVIDDEMLEKLNKAFNEVYSVALLSRGSDKEFKLMQTMMKLKDEVERGNLSRSADCLYEFVAILNNKTRPLFSMDKEEYISVFKENLRTMSYYNGSLFIGLMTKLFPNECKIEEDIDLDNFEDIIENFRQCINKYNGELIDKSFREYLQEIDYDEEKIEKIEFDPNKKYSFDFDYSGNKVIKLVDKGEEYFFSSGYDSKNEARVVYKSTEYQIDAAFVMFGLANGNLIEEFYNNTNDDNEIICYEPDVEIFIKAMHIYKLPKQEKRQRFYLFVKGLNDGNFDGIFQTIATPQRAPVVVLVTVAAYAALYRAKIIEINEDLQRASRWTSMNLNTKILRGFNAVENSIYNFPYLIKNSCLKNALELLAEYSDRTAFVVGAGPSLDKNIEHLKKVKNKAFIIAADTSVKVLLKHDIVPDMMVTIDSIKLEKTFDDDRLNDIPLLTGFEGNRTIVKNHRARIFFLTDMEYILYILEKFGKIDDYFSTGGSVGTSALNFAILAGFEKIVLVGMDFAMTDFKIHASDIYNEGTIDKNHKDLIKCDGYDGNPVYSTADLISYAEWIENLIKRNPTFNIINCTEGGINIKGVENKKLEDEVKLVDKREIDFIKLLNGAKKIFTKKEIEKLLELNKSYITYSYDLKSKLELLISDLENAKEEFKAGIKVDFTSLFERVSEFDHIENDPYKALVDIRVKEKEKKITNSVISYDKDKSEDDPLKLLEALIDILKAFSEANEEVRGMFIEVYKED